MLDDVATNNFQWPNERVVSKKAVRVYKIDAIITLIAQVVSLTNQLQNNHLAINSIQTPPFMCDYCQENHPTEECQMGDFP